MKRIRRILHPRGLFGVTLCTRWRLWRPSSVRATSLERNGVGRVKSQGMVLASPPALAQLLRRRLSPSCLSSADEPRTLDESVDYGKMPNSRYVVATLCRALRNAAVRRSV